MYISGIQLTDHIIWKLAITILIRLFFFLQVQIFVFSLPTLMFLPVSLEGLPFNLQSLPFNFEGLPFNLELHGELFLVLWLVSTFVVNILISSNIEFLTRRNAINEWAYTKLIKVVEGQLGDNEYRFWLPLAGTTLTTIFLSNWCGAVLPWDLVDWPPYVYELKSPAADPNFTLSLAFLTSISYVYAGIRAKRFDYFKRYLSPAPFFLPINVLEDITKPLSLGFRLFGNILAEEIIIGVLLTISPYIIPIPLMVNGLFGASIQGLVFSTLTCSYIAESLEKDRKLK